MSFHGRRDGQTDDMAQNGQKNPTRCRWEADDGAHTDGEAWKSFDALHDDKAADLRHPRVSISMDGFSVFGLTAAQYSCRPVFVSPLNLPPDRLCKERTFPEFDNSRALLSGEEYECRR